MNKTNQMFNSMYRSAKERLDGRNPFQIAEHADLLFKDKTFFLTSLGQETCIFWPDLNSVPALPHWHHLTLLHYLDLADGAPLCDKLMPFSGYRNGMMRGGNFDRDVERIISEQFCNTSEATLLERIKALGGELLPSNADLCAKFLFAPRYPLWLKIWFADEEFPISGRMFIDESAPHYLSVEDAVTVGTLILNRISSTEQWN